MFEWRTSLNFIQLCRQDIPYNNTIRIFPLLREKKISVWKVLTYWLFLGSPVTLFVVCFDLDESRQGFIGHARVYRLKHFTSGLLTQHHFCVSDLITEKSSGLLSGSNLRVRAIRLSVNTPKTRSRRHYRSIGRDTKRMNQ